MKGSGSVRARRQTGSENSGTPGVAGKPVAAPGAATGLSFPPIDPLPAPHEFYVGSTTAKIRSSRALVHLSPPVIDPRQVRTERAALLPAPLTSFIGRERAIVEVSELVRSARLVTLTGPGGSGKTRLGIEVARSAAPGFPDGVQWIELASVTAPELVPHCLAVALGLRLDATRAAADVVIDFLRDRTVLIVLDNCEHVLGACADTAARVLAAAPGVHLLATSRSRLAIPGERNWPVPPLSIPAARERDPERVLRAEAARLFIDRACMVLPAFRLDPPALAAIVEICRRVDGIPLAIELAAARMNVLAPAQIAARLNDSMSLLTSGARTLPHRQQTLRAAIDWSYDLLEPAERTLFARLAVFGGLFSLEQVEAICASDEISCGLVLDLLAGLTDKSLVAVREVGGEARYRLLDTVRQYAAERLRESGEETELRHRHASYFHDVVMDVAPRLRSAARAQQVVRVDAKLDNIRAALDWSRHAPGMELLHLELVGALWFYWAHRVFWDEALRRCESALELPLTPDTTAARAQVLFGAGFVAWVAGRLELAQRYLWEAVALRRELEDVAGTGMALCALAQAIVDPAQPEGALRFSSEGVLMVRRAASPWDLALMLTTSVGFVHHTAGRWDEAAFAYEEAEALWSEPNDDWGRSFALNSLAAVQWRRGQLDEAERTARASLELLIPIADHWFASRSILLLAFIALARGENAYAARLSGAAEALRREVGAHLLHFERVEHDRALAVLRERLGSTAFEEVWQEGLALRFAAACEFALGTEKPAPRAPNVEPVRVAEVIPAAMPELTIRALGPLEIRRPDRLLGPEDWTYAKPRELLFLLLEADQGCTKEQVGLALWPDASPAKLRSSFHVTLHHLRRALGRSEWIGFANGRYCFDRSLPYDYDAERFEQQVRRLALELAAAPDPARLIPELEAALALYRGDFLEDTSFGDWHLEHRDRRRRLFIDALHVLGDAQLRARRAGPATATYRRLLGHDNLSERAHRELIRALGRDGRRDEAIRHFGVMRTLLREELGAEPDPDTVALVEKVRAAQPV